MNQLVHNVIWPAVAGNVLWSFLQLAAAPNGDGAALHARLASLLLVGVYLSIDWIDADSILKELTWKYWVVDVGLAATISAFAIASQNANTWMRYPLALNFLLACAGHLCGAWDTASQPSSTRARWIFVAMNLAGLLILLLGSLTAGSFGAWSIPLSIAVVVLLYWLFRQRVLGR